MYSYEECKAQSNKFVISSVKYAEEIEELLKNDNREYFANIDEWASTQEFDKVAWNRLSCAWPSCSDV